MKKHTTTIGKRSYRNAEASVSPETGVGAFRDGAFGMLIPEIQRAISIEGYREPTPVQKQCIPFLLEGRDLLGTAQTGTGKTAAFALPLIQRLTARRNRLRRGTPRALVVAPTRELAAQIGKSISLFSRYLNFRHTVLFGGVKQYAQVKALERGVDALVATPGRLLDLMQQGFVHLDSVEIFVLDEVDRMLDMGFIHDIDRIQREMPANRQTLFFSATMAPGIEKLAEGFVKNPVKVTIDPEKATLESIAQKVLFVEKRDKDALLASLLSTGQVRKALVFTQMKHTANNVAKKLAVSGVSSAAIHGNKSQAMRTRTLEGFRKGRFQVLVATDVAARGLDVDDITHVFNYDLPVESETYIHRIGRTARAGAAGDAVSFCSSEDRSYLREIEKLLGRAVPTDTEHEYHSEAASKSLKPAPKNFGRTMGRKRASSFSGRRRGNGFRRTSTNTDKKRARR